MKSRLWENGYAYEQQALVHRMNGQPDSAITYHIKAMEQDSTQNVFSLDRQVLEMLVGLKDVRQALGYLEEVRKRMKRADIPYYHLGDKQALLREKDARMREELFMRMHVFEKLSDTEEEKHIQLSDTDWKEIQLMLDSGYDDFTKKLRARFPMLSEKDINFCCLVRINMSIQSLTDIYCISKNSVSRRKLRLKEKLGIDKDDSLATFLEQIG